MADADGDQDPPPTPPPAPTTTFMMLPEETRLHIIHKMDDQASVLNCRAVCKDFVPKDLTITLVLNAPGSMCVSAFMNCGQTQYVDDEIQRKDVEAVRYVDSVNDLPHTFLAKMKYMQLVVGQECADEMATLVREVSTLKSFCMLDAHPEVFPSLQALINGSKAELTDVCVWDHNGFSENQHFNGNWLKDCEKLAILTSGNWPITNLTSLPTSLTNLSMTFPVPLPDIVWMSEHLINLTNLALSVTEKVDKSLWSSLLDGVKQILGMNGPQSEPIFTADLLKKLCAISKMDEMVLVFGTELPLEETQKLSDRLKEVVATCNKDMENVTADVVVHTTNHIDLGDEEDPKIDNDGEDKDGNPDSNNNANKPAPAEPKSVILGTVAITVTIAHP